MGKRVAILQSNYIPWRGYFDIIASVDEFVLFDVVQFTKNDWRNRNRIKTRDGPQWLTIPVVTSGRSRQRILDVQVATSNWADKHWKSIAQAYATAPFFRDYRDRIEASFAAAANLQHLSGINTVFIELLARELGAVSRITHASAYDSSGDRNERLVKICRAASASVYVTGPSARAYLDMDLFRDAGIDVQFMDYSHYRPYPQLHGPFEPSVSVLDLLFNTGPAAASYIGGGGAHRPIAQQETS